MRNEHTKKITERFVEAMTDVIRKNKLNGGKITSVKAFAESLGQLPQNFSKYTAMNQHVTNPIIEIACRKYNISPNYLILGIGEMYLSDDVTGKTDRLEDRIKRLERLLEVKPKLKRV